MSRDLAIGVDLGGTKVESALVGADGEVVRMSRIATRPEQGASRVLDRIGDEINALIEVADRSLYGIGIGAPGFIDTEAGVVLESVNLNWYGVELVKGLAERVKSDLPILLQMDALASALGEFYYGAGKGCSSFVYLSIGTGFGGGVVLKGKLLAGEHGLAGAVGHFSLDPGGLPCKCGLRGCPETTVSGDGLLRIVKKYLADGTHPSHLTSETASVRAVVKAAENGDELSRVALEDMGRVIGTVIALCAVVLDPSRFVIGGGLGLAAFDFLMPAARAELQRRVLPVLHRDIRILPSGLASSAVGASCLVWASLEDS